MCTESHFLPQVLRNGLPPARVLIYMNAHVDVWDAATRMGPVTLYVADVEQMLAYYHRGVGLTLLSRENDQAVLGRGSSPVLIIW